MSTFTRRNISNSWTAFAVSSGGAYVRLELDVRFPDAEYAVSQTQLLDTVPGFVLDRANPRSPEMVLEAGDVLYMRNRSRNPGEHYARVSVSQSAKVAGNAGTSPTPTDPTLGPSTASYQTETQQNSQLVEFSGLYPGEIVSRMSPNDGRVVLGADGKRAFRGKTNVSPGDNIYTFITSAGRSFDVVFTVASSAGIVYPTITSISALPTLSVPYHRVYSPFKVSSGYTGPTLQLRRLSDNALSDVTPDQTTGIPAAQAASRVRTMYDQSGNAANATHLTASNQPLYDLATAEAGVVPVLFDYYPSKSPKFLNIASTALDRGAVGYFSVLSVRQGNFLDVLATFYPPSGTTDLLAIYTGSNLGLVSGASGGAQQKANKFLRNRRQAVGYANDANGGATGERFYSEGTKVSGAARSALAMNTAGRIGGDSQGGSPSNHASFVEVILAGTPTDADMAALDAWAIANFKINTVPAAQRIIYSGSSLIPAEGRSLGRGPANWPTVSQDLGRSTDDVDIVDMAVSGRTLQTEYSSRATLDFAAILSGARNVLVIDAASNDIGTATYADAAAATSGADSFYSGTIVPFVAAARAAGIYNTVVPTIVGRTAFDESVNFRLTALKRLNQNIVNGAAANRYVCADRYGDARLQNPADATYFHTDAIHLNDAGGAVLDAIDRTAISAAMKGPAL